MEIYEYGKKEYDNNHMYSLLCSSTLFPSRVSVPNGSSHYFQSIARRLYRIFAHSYFHHNEIFTEFEEMTSLCKRFVYFVTMFKLMSSTLLIIPNMN